MFKFIRLNLPILGILLIASILRFWGINFGLPQAQIGDEATLVGSAFYAGAHWLQPLRAAYGQLVPYLLLFEFGIYYLIGVSLGTFKTANDLLISVIRDPRDLILIGRVTMAIAGIATVWLTYFVGRTFYSKRIGIFAAFFLAISFLHVKESHYLKEGNLAAFFALACYYFTLKILLSGNRRDYFWAGATLGLGIGAKYEPVLMLPVFLLSHIIKNKKSLKKGIWFFINGFVVALFITFPILFINPKGYFSLFVQDFKTAKLIYPLHLMGKPVWWWFFFVHIPQGLGILLFITALFGFVISFIKSVSAKTYFFIPLLPFIFLTTIDFWQKFHAARYALLVLPYFALGAAVFLDWILAFIKNIRLQMIVILILVAGFIFSSLMRDIKFNTIILKPDTRLITKDWIEKNIPAETKILVESMVRPEYPANINVPLTLSQKTIDRYITQAHTSGYPGTYLNALKIAKFGRVGYDLVATARVDVAKDLVTDTSIPLTSARYWVNEKVDFLVVSSWHVKPNVSPSIQKTLEENYELIQEFNPNPAFSDDPHFVQMDYYKLDSINVFSKDLIFGPKIQIYQIKKDFNKKH